MIFNSLLRKRGQWLEGRGRQKKIRKKRSPGPKALPVRDPWSCVTSRRPFERGARGREGVPGVGRARGRPPAGDQLPGDSCLSLARVCDRFHFLRLLLLARRIVLSGTSAIAAAGICVSKIKNLPPGRY